MPVFTRLAVPLLGVSLLLAVPLPAAATEDTGTGPAVVIFDGSGSMWGQIGTERPAKYELARGALREALSTLSPRVELGLMSFGHRRRGDCSDVEVLASPAANATERVLSAADSISPRGRGPLTQALRGAASQIPADRSGSIIAIHDGPDNCSQDPCSAAREIAASHPKTRVFLIGFGVARADAQRLACVADATGGRVFETQDSASLGAALSEALTLGGLSRVDPATGVAVPVPQAATPPKAAGAPGLRLSASLAAGGPTVTQPVDWTITKTGAPDVAVATGRGPEFATELDPGSYLVTAKLGRASAQQTAEVTDEGPVDVQIGLGAGALKLAVKADRDGTPLTHPLITVYAKDADEAPGRHPVWIGRDAGAELVLPAGAYVVRIEDGFVSETADVSLAEGVSVDVAPVLGAGRLELAAVSATSDEPLEEITYVIEEDDPFSPQGRREVARSADPSAALTLPAGTYYVTARSGALETHERIALGSGDVVRHVAVFNIVKLTVSALVTPPVADGGAGGRPVVIRILNPDRPEQEIARANAETGVFHLPPGRYRVEAAISGKTIHAAGSVDLAAGRDVTAEIRLESGEVHIANAGTARHWRIKDGEGRTVMHSGPGMATTARLAPGRYEFIADGAPPQAFDLAAGARQDLNLAHP